MQVGAGHVPGRAGFAGRRRAGGARRRSAAGGGEKVVDAEFEDVSDKKKAS